MYSFECLWQLVEKEINGGNPAIARNDEIGPTVSWCFIRATRYPSDPPSIAPFLGLGNHLISKVRVSGFDLACHLIDLVATVVDAVGRMEHTVFGENLVDGGSSARRIVFTKAVMKIARQQRGYAVG